MADSSFRINRGITLNPQASAPTSPTNGDVYYDSVLNTYSFYENGFWINLASRVDVASATDLTSANFTSSVVQHSFAKLTGVTASTLHGLQASVDGKEIVVYNNTGQLLTIANQSGTEGTAANRIVTHTSSNIIVPTGMAIKLVYESTQARWVLAAPAVDGLDKLFEDRNALLTQGGLITYTGTQVQFTEALALEINQRESGAAPVVISLGSTTRNISASGRMIYAVVDRGAGTATVTDDATTLPAAIPTNQEVFLIAKRVDAGDGTKRLYWRNGMALNEGQTVRLGASGSGSGSGLGDDLASLLFRASFTDLFDESPTSSTSAVNPTSATNATYSAAKALYQMSYDASYTVTGTGTSMTLSGTPAFTVAIGDMLIVGSEAKKITAVATQTSYTIESAFTTDPSAAAACVSQAVHTIDIYGSTIDGTALSTAFGSETFSEIAVDYEDTTTVGDNIFDVNTAPVVAFTASHNGSSWTTLQNRPTLETDTIGSVNLNAAGTALYLRFFAKKTSGSGTVNVLRYKAFMQKSQAAAAGGVINASYAFTNGVGTPVNCSVSVVAGKTTITLSGWQYAVGVGSGLPYGSIDVYLNGQLIPRYIDATLTPDASYLETSPSVITLDKDYSALNVSVEVLQRAQVIDASTTNTSAITALQEIGQKGFQGFADESNKLVATTTTGAPAAGTFHSTVIGRASIPDLSQDLKPRMGLERIAVQAVYELQNEFGSSGERVFAALNDDRGLMRFVGGWANINESSGARVQTVVTGSYAEITFYGTGLNLITLLYSSSQTATYQVDGGSAQNLVVSTSYATLNTGRFYFYNQVLPVVSGLTLGTHTVRINFGAFDLEIGGFEILNEASTIKVQPGSSYLNGKKLTLSSQQSLAYNSSFESGTLGTRGGHVVVYQKADGSIAKAVTPTDSASATLSSTNHTNEEVIRTYHWREFGAGRSDDFSLLAQGAAPTNLAFTLDDGTTTLIAQNASVYATSGGQEIHTGSQASDFFFTLTFVGTGLDVVGTNTTSATTKTTTVTVDGTSIGSIAHTVNGGTKVFKIVSGLPYGTHTIKVFTAGSAGQVAPITWGKFIVYGPKKPAIPSGAVELADYNVMADFVANSTAGLETIATGVLRKQLSQRELIYVNGTGGTQDWLSGFNVTSNIGGWVSFGDRTNSYIEYTFFGTGFEFRTSARSDNSANITVSLNGTAATTANFPSMTTSTYGTGVVYTASTATLDLKDASTTSGSGFRLSNLPLAKYTVKFNQNTASAGLDFLRIDVLDIITPIYSYKSKLYADLQNTLPVGSNAISDNRSVTPVKELTGERKAWVQTSGITANPSTTSTAYVPMPDMSTTIKTSGGPIQVSYSALLFNSAATNSNYAQIYVDGSAVGTYKAAQSVGGSAFVVVSDSLIVPVSAGVHKVDIYWRCNGGTIFANDVTRNLTVREL